MKKKYFKPILEYVVLILFGLGAGYGYLNYNSQSSNKVTEEVGDYRSFFENETTEIIMLGTSWCPSCEKMRNYLNKSEVLYKEYDIEQTKIGAELFGRSGKHAVPILMTKSLRIVGLPKQNRLYEIINNTKN